MLSPHEITWLDFALRSNDVVLQECQLPYSTFRQLPFPEAKTPQIISLIGNHTKNIVSKNSFGIQVCPGNKGVLLQRCPEKYNFPSPIFIADSNLHQLVALQASLPRNNGHQHSIRWHTDNPRNFDPMTLTHLVHTHLLLPISTVTCIFADDLGGLNDVASILATWLTKLGSHQASTSHYAKVLVFTSWESPKPFDERLATRGFRGRVHQHTSLLVHGLAQWEKEILSPSVFDSFLREIIGDITVLALSKQESIKDRVFQESFDAHDRRRTAGRAFSALHLEQFLHLGCQHLARSASQFCFIKASRAANPVPEELVFHLESFFKIIPKKNRTTFLRTMISSALCLDAFPPGHHKFRPDDVFQSLYSKHLEQAHPTIRDAIGIIKAQFGKEARVMRETFEEISIIHKRVLGSFSSTWTKLKSNTTCLSCLVRRPNYPLSCGHSLCDYCLMLNSATAVEDLWTLEVDKCPLCHARNQLPHSIKPYTAGIRALTIDGGTLEDMKVLNSLEQRLNPSVGISECFDIVIGSGLGALMGLEIFCKEGTVEQCLARLKGEKSLWVKSKSRNSRFSQASAIRPTYFNIQNNGIVRFSRLFHNSGTSRNTMSYINESYRSRTKLFGHSAARIGLVVKRSKDSETCLISSYNISEESSFNVIHLRRDNYESEILLSQSAKMAVSRRSYRGFSMHECSSKNNLIKTTLQEQNIIWKRKEKSPDVLVVVGAPTFEYTHTKPPPPILDYRGHHKILNETADRLISSLFYIELVDRPQLVKGGYFCRIQIRCRLLPSTQGYQTLLKRLRECDARFHYDHRSIYCSNGQMEAASKEGIPFRRHCEMTVLSLGSEVDVKIDGVTERSTSISNCPYRLQHIIEDQGLDCVFGRSDHKKRVFGPGVVYDCI